MIKIFNVFFMLFLLMINISYADINALKESPETKNPVTIQTSHDKNIIYLKLKIEDDWVLYSNQLGDVGYPMELDKISSENLASFDIIFPDSKTVVEERNGMQSVYHIYEKEAVIEIATIPIDSSKDIDLKLNLQYGVCKELCHLFQYDIIYHLPALNENTGSANSIIWMIILATLGGLILNFMPCCLPVLSIKILSLIGCKNQSEIRINAFWTIVGIVTSFLLLAFAVVLLKIFGHAVGWGMHFQEPIFLMVITMITIFFAINLWGVFEIQLPGRAVNRIATTSYYNQALSSFFTGITATLLATPCSAPFLSSSVAFALTQSNLIILITYFAMGIGMSTPYVLLFIHPKLAVLLPKPGLWMDKIKKTFGLLLILTACWLLYILSHHFSNMNMFLFISSIALLSLILIKYRSLNKVSLIAIISVVAITIAYLAQPTQEIKIEESSQDIWESFDQSKLDEYIGKGRVLFIDITAQWCMTCKYNKNFVFEKGEFIDFVKKNNIVLMRANYTLKSDEITNFMALHKRSGVPLNVLYGPGKKDGIVLSEILNFKDIVSAMNKLSINN